MFYQKKIIGKNLKKTPTIALNVLYLKRKKLYPAYVSKHNSDRQKQVIILMIPNEEGWHYLAVKKLSTLLTGITLNITVIFIVSIAFILSQHKSHKKVCGNKDFCNVVMPPEDTKILEFNQNHKAPFIIYADLER